MTESKPKVKRVRKVGRPKSKIKKPRKRNKNPDPARSSIKRHQDVCKVCKHQEREEIERRFLIGESVYEIAEDFNVDYWTIDRHTKAYKLQDKREEGTLRQVSRIINRARLGKREPTDALVSKALELKAKITGELIERHKHEVAGQLDVAAATARQMKNLKKRIGVEEDEEAEKTT